MLHASGVVLDGRAVLITGPSGAGKSSLAAALVRAGGQLLSDDAVALALSDGTLIAHAGSVALQLRAAEDERLSAEERAASGARARLVDGKHRYVSAHTAGRRRLEACSCSSARPMSRPSNGLGRSTRSS